MTSKPEETKEKLIRLYQNEQLLCLKEHYQEDDEANHRM